MYIPIQIDFKDLLDDFELDKEDELSNKNTNLNLGSKKSNSQNVNTSNQNPIQRKNQIQVGNQRLKDIQNSIRRKK